MIDKHIPIPVRGKITGFLRMLEIGDSVLLDLEKQKHISTISKQIGIKCATRREDGKVRVWRTA